MADAVKYYEEDIKFCGLLERYNTKQRCEHLIVGTVGWKIIDIVISSEMHCYTTQTQPLMSLENWITTLALSLSHMFLLTPKAHAQYITDIPPIFARTRFY
jgi:hypothetical protein